jgi:hypothetical protein
MEIFCSLFMSAGILFQLSITLVPSQFHLPWFTVGFSGSAEFLASVADPDPNPNMQKNFLKKLFFCWHLEGQ